MLNHFPELHQLLSQTAQEYRRGLREIIGAPSADSPSVLCEHLFFLRAGAAGQGADKSNYKQLVTDIADKVGIDWGTLLAGTAWAALAAEQIEAAIVHHVEADKMYVHGAQPKLPAAIAALDNAFSSLSSDWRKLLAAIIYIHQVIRPSDGAVLPSAESASGQDGTLPAGAPILAPAKKTGTEPLHAGPDKLGPTLLDIWRWAAADLAGNSARAVLAEYIVACALGLQDGVRPDGDGADILLHPTGLKIEVRAAVSTSSPPAEIRFPIRSNRFLDNGVSAVDLKRRSDVHVFCLPSQGEPKTLDPLDVAQWEFYVVQSSVLDAKFPLGKSIGLPGLQALGVRPVTYPQMSECILQYTPNGAGIATRR